jgi:hypothetical protein
VNFPALDPTTLHPITLCKFIPSERVQDRGAQRGGQYADRIYSPVAVKRRLHRKLQQVILNVHAPERLLREEMSDGRNARRALLLDARFQLFGCLLRDGLVVRRVQRRVDGDEPDDPLSELEEPKSRGGRARVVILDVEQVYTSEDFLGRVFNERSIFPIYISAGGGERSRFLLEPKQEGGLVACITNRRRT